MPRKLKVFRTAAGFQDAYVAAPSRKAALAAWGSDADLFARGVAEEVTDPALMAEPLAHPGAVVKRSRGSAQEQLAALPPGQGKGVAAASPSPARPEPEPDRSALDRVERALAEAARTHDARRRALDERRVALEREIRAEQRAWQRERDGAEKAVERARAAYDAAVKAWRG